MKSREYRPQGLQTFFILERRDIDVEPGEGLRVLGLDPGINITGYGVVEMRGGAVELVEGGVLRTDPKDPLELRLRTLHEALGGVLEEFRPSCVAVEALFTHYQRPRTAIVMGHARGALLLAAAQHDLAVTGYPPSRVKKAITGSGRASKEQVQGAVAASLGIDEAPKPADVSDALAVALCHCDALRRESVHGGGDA